MATSAIGSSPTTVPATSSPTASASSASAGLIKALGTGSGIDTQALATSLVAAERAPRQAIIDSKISKAQATITGFSAVKYTLTNLQSAFAALNDVSDFQNITASNSQTSAFTAVVDPASTAAAAGSHSVVVNTLATAQRVTGVGGFASADVTIPGLTQLTLAGKNIPVSPPTPTAVVDAINAAGNGFSAQLINTGNANNPFQIVVTGAMGAAGAFTLTSNATNAPASPPSLEFGTTLQEASNASLNVDGIPISSSSNQVQGAIAGVTLNLLAPTATTTANNVTTPVAAQLNMSQDTSNIVTNVKALVTAYNDAVDLLHELTTSGSALATYGGTMVGNSTVGAIRDQMRDMVTAKTSTGTVTMNALRDIGVELDSKGHLTSNSVKLDMALKFNFKDTVKMLSGNQQDQSPYDKVNKAGVAGDSVKAITAMLSTTGMLSTESDNANTRISTYQDQISKLNDRMTALLARYTKQFSAMDILVGQNKSMSTGLTSTFAGMMSTYTNK